MPIYEYKCGECATIFEAARSVDSRDKLIFCRTPRCPGEGKKIVSKTSFILKGGGWYEDGYAKKET